MFQKVLAILLLPVVIAVAMMACAARAQERPAAGGCEAIADADVRIICLALLRRDRRMCYLVQDPHLTSLCVADIR